VQAIGFLIGLVLYAMLGWMSWRRHGSQIGPRPIGTAMLGVIWNLGALWFYGAPALGLGAAPPILGVVALSALGFLPAAVVQGAVRASPSRFGTWLTVAAYAVSSASLVMQVWSLFGAGVTSQMALVMQTFGYSVILVLMVWRARGSKTPSASLAAVGLAVFAIMVLHLSQHHDGSDSMLTEVFGHQGSLPLVFLILYQDYRFAFADLFLKRAIALLMVVVVASLLYVPGVEQILTPASADGGAQSRDTIWLIAYAVVVAALYPSMQGWAARFVDRRILRRVDYPTVRRRLAESLADTRDEGEVIRAVADAMAHALSTNVVSREIVGELPDTQVGASKDGLPIGFHIPIPTNEWPHYRLHFGPLTSGRRMLSDDVQLVEWSVVIAAKRIDALRIDRERFDRAAGELELRRLVSEAELRALRAQLDPHFLFNALTTIGHLMTEAPARAQTTLLQLTGLLRAVLRPGTAEALSLGEELEIVAAYLAIEHARFEERLQFTIDVPKSLRALRVPPMLLQPLVENAVKHGLAPLRQGGAVVISASIKQPLNAEALLVLIVRDTGVGIGKDTHTKRRHDAVGLSNIEQRLANQFGSRAGLTIANDVGGGCVATVWLPVSGSALHPFAQAGVVEAAV